MKKALYVFAGLVVTTMAYILFLNPYAISVGGMTGLSLIITRYVALPNSIILLLLNVVLFAYGLKVRGWAFTLRSIASMLALGMLLDYIPPIPAPIVDKNIAMVVGSVLSGIGYGLIVSTETSTGGSDQLALIVTKAVPELSVGLVMNAFDAIVITIDCLITHNWLFSAIAVVLCNSMIDIVDCVVNKKGWPEWTVVPRIIYKHLHKPIWVGCVMLVIVLVLRHLLIGG